MQPLFRENDGIWLGWAGDSEDGDSGERQSILQNWASKERCFPIELPPEVSKGFYEGYANQSLWPVFHSFPSRLRFDAASWDAYVEANRIFCRAVVARYQPGDLIWVHDYHLLLLPQLLRAALPEAAIGFFLHIPFPSSEIFPILPRREELLRGLLGADMVAFQTHGHLQHFRAAVLRVLGVESRTMGVDVGNRTTRLEALPIGIAPQEYTDLLENDTATKGYYQDWSSQHSGRKVLLAVDRLDYTKGVPERLRAFRKLLQSSPELREKSILIQIAIPTREGIDSYQELRGEVNRLVGEINGKLGKPDWTPIIYINRSIERKELVALYKLADICWVGPLRDGMNLVAKEYVACKYSGDGVLLLSEFAGAAAEMGEALLINPFDEDGAADTIARALALDVEEKQDRMRALHARVLRNDVFRWGDRFLTALKDAVASRVHYGDTQPKPLLMAEVQQAYSRAKQRLIILDYDGTLVPHVNSPQRAAPPRAVVRLLENFVSDANNTVAIASGRPAKDLDRWFRGINGMWLLAEHGAAVRDPHKDSWEALRPEASVEWKATVLPILEHFVDRTPGSFVEEKQYSVVWHYRMAEPEFGEWLANELVSMLEAMLAETELRAVRGEKIVEIKPVWANKGEALERLLVAQPRPDFLFAAGNDRTDEDLFERASNANGWTVHVGPGPTRASFVVPDVEAILAVLATLTNLSPLRPITT
jgi:trehalose 6-phosphate synthase/phosphatase